MIDVHCRTNLDTTEHEIWPTSLPDRPVKGDRIQSAQKWGPFQLELEVVDTTWKRYKAGGWYLEVELHIPQYGQPRMILEWHEWYKNAKSR